MNEISTMTPSDSAKVLRRKVYEALEDAYDERFKRYKTKLKGEFTDASIAKTVGCSVDLVTKIRDEFFGPATRAEPTEEIRSLQITLANLEKEGQELNNLAAGLGVQVRAHRQKIGVVKDDLTRLCETQGWAH
jgi:hypothetical protein